MTRKTMVLPARFTEDWASCCDQLVDDNSRPGWEFTHLAESSRGSVVSIGEKALADLLDRAEFYAEAGVAEFGPEYLGLIRSAAATVKRIKGA